MTARRGKLIFAVLAISVGSGFQHGYHAGIVNFPAEVLQKWIKAVKTGRLSGKTPSDRDVMVIWSITVAMFSVGGMFGACLIGYFADRWGRKRSLIWNNGIILIAITLSMCSKAFNVFELFIFGRFLAGINAGLSAGLCQIYLTEISPDAIRGAVGSIYQLVLCVSILIAQVAGLVFGTDDDWPFIFVVALFPAGFQLTCLWFCPESPKYLLLHLDNEKKAEQALVWLRGGEDNIATELENLIEEDNLVRQMHASLLRRIIGNPSLKKSLIRCSVLNISQQLCGVNGVIYFSTKTLEELGMGLNAAFLTTIGFSVVLIVTTIIAICLIDNVGRRVMLQVSFLGMSIVTTIFFYMLIIGIKSNNSEYIKYVAIVCACLFIAFFSMGAGPIPWFITAELIVYSARSLAVSITVFCNWFANILVEQAFLSLQIVVGYYVYVIFIILDVFFFCYVLHFPETKQMSAIEIIKMYK